jgi:hypothetical protein
MIIRTTLKKKYEKSLQLYLLTNNKLRKQYSFNNQF